MPGFTRQTARTAAGLGIVAGLVGAAVLIVLLADIVRLFRSEVTVVAVLEEGGSIISGSPVWLAGSEVGTVSRVSLLPVPPGVGEEGPPRVAMHLRIPRDLHQQIRADAYARITSISPIGEQAVNIAPGTPGHAAFPLGDTLPGSPLPSAAELMAEAEALKTRVDSMLAEVGVVRPLAVSAMERYGRLATRAQSAGSELGELRAEMTQEPAWSVLTSGAFDRNLAGARAHAAALQPEMAAFMARLDSVRAVAAPVVDRMSARADSLSARLALLEASLSAQGGFLGRIQTDSALVKALRGTRAQLDSLIADARANPLRYVF